MAVHPLRDTFLPVTQQQHMGKVHLYRVLQDTKERLVQAQLHVRILEAGQQLQDVLLKVSVRLFSCMYT